MTDPVKETIIDNFFGQFYQRVVLMKTDATDIVQTARQRLEASSALLDTAKKTLENTPQELEQRCHVSKIKRQFLTQALEGLS